MIFNSCPLANKGRLWFYLQTFAIMSPVGVSYHFVIYYKFHFATIHAVPIYSMNYDYGKSNIIDVALHNFTLYECIMYYGKGVF